MINLQESQFERVKAVLRETPKQVPHVVSRAINRAAESARTEAARKVRETYYIGARDVTATIKIKPAGVGKLSATVLSRGHAVSLTKFQVNPRAPSPRRQIPIVVRVKRGGGGPVKRAFVGRMPTGHLGVYSRAGRARFPITEHFGPPVPQMLGNPSVVEWVEQKATETLDRRIDHEMQRVLERGNP